VGEGDVGEDEAESASGCPHMRRKGEEDRRNQDKSNPNDQEVRYYNLNLGFAL
jgi:hypothetical protein